MTSLINHRRDNALPGLWHDYANLFPMLDAAGQDALRADVQQHGVREPVIQFEGRILDGRNRYMAARDLGLDFPVAEFDGTPAEALAYVLSINLHRRHLTESQRAAVAAKLAKEYAKHDDSGAKSAAAAERWSRERELRAINDMTGLPYDAKASMCAALQARWARASNTERKRDWRQVYVAASGDQIKIGVSSLPEQRIDMLRAGRPDIVLLDSWPGGFDDEKALHSMLSDVCVGGEWFAKSEEALERIAAYMQDRQLAAVHEAPIKTAAKLMNVGQRSVERAKAVIDAAGPELVAAIEAGDASVNAAAALIHLPAEEQAATVAEGPDAVKAKAREVREARSAPSETVRKRDTPPSEPADPERRKLAKMTTEGLIDEVLGLRANLADEKAKTARLKNEKEDLSAKLKEALSGDQGRVIGSLQRQLDQLKGRIAEHQTAAKRWERKFVRAEARVKELENLPIDMGAI